MNQVLLSRKAAKDLDKVEKKYKPHIFSVLFDLRENPYLGKKLKGKLQDCYSLRIGSYRIIYKIYKSEFYILVIRIGRRQGVYE